MKYLVVSDTHTYPGLIGDITELCPDADGLIHLGDGAADAEEMAPYFSGEIITVRGNCDPVNSSPDWRIITVGDTSVFLCHGHLFGVRQDRNRLASKAKLLGCKVALYGHTHIKCDETILGVRVINPGSLAFPYGEKGAYLLDGDSGTLKISFIPAV